MKQWITDGVVLWVSYFRTLHVTVGIQLEEDALCHGNVSGWTTVANLESSVIDAVLVFRWDSWDFQRRSCASVQRNSAINLNYLSLRAQNRIVLQREMNHFAWTLNASDNIRITSPCQRLDTRQSPPSTRSCVCREDLSVCTRLRCWRTSTVFSTVWMFDGWCCIITGTTMILSMYCEFPRSSVHLNHNFLLCNTVKMKCVCDISKVCKIVWTIGLCLFVISSIFSKFSRCSTSLSVWSQQSSGWSTDSVQRILNFIIRCLFSLVGFIAGRYLSLCLQRTFTALSWNWICEIVNVCCAVCDLWSLLNRLSCSTSCGHHVRRMTGPRGVS